jgi:hypothetical protein
VSCLQKLSMDVLRQETSVASAAAVAAAVLPTAHHHHLGSGSGNNQPGGALGSGSAPDTGADNHPVRCTSVSQSDSQGSGSHGSGRAVEPAQLSGSRAGLQPAPGGGANAHNMASGSKGSTEQVEAASPGVSPLMPGGGVTGGPLAQRASSAAGGSGGSGGEGLAQPLDEVLAEHQQKFTALKLKSDQVELQVGAQECWVHKVNDLHPAPCRDLNPAPPRDLNPAPPRDRVCLCSIVWDPVPDAVHPQHTYQH